MVTYMPMRASHDVAYFADIAHSAAYAMNVYADAV